MWRSMVLGPICGAVVGFVVGFVIGFTGALIGMDREAVTPISMVSSAIAGFLVSMFVVLPIVIRWALRKQYKTFHIKLVPGPYDADAFD